MKRLSSTVAIVAVTWLTVAVGAQEWQQWSGPDGDFTVASGALAESWPETGPRQLWKRPLGEGFSSILHRDGTLYTMYRNGDDEIVVALDASSGATRWQHSDTPTLWSDMTDAFGNGPNSTPLLIGDRLVAPGIAGRLRGLDASSGELVWQRDLPEDFGRRRRVEEYGYSANPVVYGGRVLVLVGGDQHAVVALNPADGSVVWKSEAGGVSYAQPSILRLAGRDQFVYFSPQGVVALDPTTGETLWTSPIEFNNGNHLTPAVSCDDEHLWIGSQFESGGGRLLRIRSQDGGLNAEQVWFDARLQTSHWPMIRRGDLIYGSTGGNRVSFLSAFDWRTGKVAWKKRGYHKAQILHADGKFLFLTEDGRLVLARMSPEELQVLAEAKVTGRVSWSLPTLVSTTLYLRDQEHVLAQRRLRSTRPVGAGKAKAGCRHNL
ncbi:MAG: PQQ-like beta-propeller repeat protein [Thermoanaerobaculia bacterium]|nr:PQQ-like beta-propeller repeat protein [Thermoanaerobaculia bacterium]